MGHIADLSWGDFKINLKLRNMTAYIVQLLGYAIQMLGSR